VIRTLLVNLPFAFPNRPNLALSQLQAVLRSHRYPCEILYAELDFAREIGATLYSLIAEKYPQELLLGDVVFAPFIADAASDPPVGPHLAPLTERHLIGATNGTGRGKVAEIPSEFWDLLPTLRSKARAFLERTCDRIYARAERPDLVGFSLAFTVTPNLALARLLKTRSDPPAVIVGGSGCDGQAGLAFHEAFPQLDFVCRGEGEAVIIDLVRHLDGQGPAVDAIRGLVFREGGRSRSVGSRADNIADLDALPVPRFEDWMHQMREAKLPLSAGELVLPFESSRGCWYGEKVHCTFCGLVGPSLVFRTKSPERVLAELRELANYGIPNADAVDLIFNHRFFDTLLPRLAREEHGLSIFYEIKSNLRRDQLVRLKQAGIDSIQPGIESLSTKILALMRKGVQAYQNVLVLKWAAELGIRVTWNILYGFPHESPEDYVGMAALVPRLVHLPPPTTGCTPLVLSRFSPLHYDAVSLGVTNVRPAPAYSLVYALEPSVIERVAYFFDFDPAEPLDTPTYIAPLRDAVARWQAVAGRCVFEGTDLAHGLRLLDTRPVATVREIVLDRDERAVYRACDAGATEESVVRQTGLPRGLVADTLQRFIEHDWIAVIDGRMVALAVARRGTAFEELS
jgi:ribosomal peptide maturation radical SAM protein 1